MLDETSGDLHPAGQARQPNPVPSAAVDELLPVIYEELRRLAHARMSREPVGHTLQTTAIVHEAYIRLVEQNKDVWQSREHFLAVASQMIRRVLVDHARARQSIKRGGRLDRVAIFDVPVADAAPRTGANDAGLDVLALDEALTDLGRLDARQSRVVELRYFGGLSIEETATALGISIGTVKGDWRVARAWLKQRLAGGLSA